MRRDTPRLRPPPLDLSWSTLCLALLLLLGGCGRKGNPVAPERRVPLPPTELAATVRPGEIGLSWLIPTRRVDHSRALDIETARLYRVVDAGSGEPRPAILSGDRIAGYTETAVIRLDRPEPAAVESGRVRYRDRLDLKEGQRYTYVVTASDAQGRTSAPSPRLSVTFIAAPAPPSNLRGQAGEQQVQLAWDAPRGLADGRPLAGAITYEVRRASSPGAPPTPVSPGPVTGTTYTATGLENERTYFYSVHAVRGDGGGMAQSDPSGTIALTPRKTTPPSPPTGLVAIPSAGAVRLAWNPSPEADIAGYLIYRAAGSGESARIGRVTGPATVFVDRGVAPGAYRYAVSAFDGASTPNVSARSAEVAVTVP